MTERDIDRQLKRGTETEKQCRAKGNICSPAVSLKFLIYLINKQSCLLFLKDKRASPNPSISTLPPPPPPLPLPPPDVASVEASIQSQFFAAAQRGEGFPFPGNAAMQHLQPLLQPPQAHTGSVKVNGASRNGNPDLAATGKCDEHVNPPLLPCQLLPRLIILSGYLLVRLSLYLSVCMSISVSLHVISSVSMHVGWSLTLSRK